MQNDPLQLITGLLNLPDLVILAVIAVNIALGYHRGFLASLCGLVGKFAALGAAFFTARAAAPTVARLIVTPIVGEVFEKQAALSASYGILDGLRQNVTEAAVSMAESIAFLLLLVLGCILFGWLVVLAVKSLRFISHLTPLGVLDSLGGGVIGLAAGILLVVVVLVGIQWVSPITYTSLGWLSPQRVADTTLLAALVDILPVAL